MCCKADVAAPHELLFIEKDAERMQRKHASETNISYDISQRSNQDNQFSNF
jgi:hypothetical protein